MELDGGLEALNEILSRKLFDAELAARAAVVEEGVFCCADDGENA
jgi:hypothetical protein